jgi:CRISPR-associated protein Csb2
VVPEDPVITFQWDQANGAAHQPALRTLVENLTYLGHSASPIRACLREDMVEPTLVPDDDRDCARRTPGPGRLQRLEAVHQQRLTNEAMQPPLGQSTTYGKPSQPHSVFSTQALVMSFTQGPKLSLDASLPLMQRLRDALLARLNEQLPPSLCGHALDGSPSRDPHLALIPLAFVDARHADGSLKGAALVLPRALEPPERRRLRAAIDEPWLLHLGSLGSITMQLLAAQPDDLQALQFTKWYGRSATCWASVTPVVLDRHPKKKGPTVEVIIAESCTRIGLPPPVEVRTGNTSAFKGAPPVHPFLGRSSRMEGRPMQHVLVRFAEEVRGPVLLGAGRFFGMGLCRPWINRRPE